MRKLILSAVDRELSIAWNKIAGEYETPDGENFVEVKEGNILDLEVDAIVSPANSFGFMDGGIDYAYSRFFGMGVQDTLQHRLKEWFHGELLVGQALAIPTGHPKIRYVISAPTMRTPIKLPHNTINPFLAARAALRCAKATPDIMTLAMPGLGTGVGEVDPELCAHQVKEAIDEVFTDSYMFPVSWEDAVDREQYLWYREAE
jgi:O-acetyl-ADP-ribose deacetylase (regulator of RNase III)